MEKLTTLLIIIGMLGVIATVIIRLFYGPVVNIGITGVAPSSALAFSNSLILIALGLKQLKK